MRSYGLSLLLVASCALLSPSPAAADQAEDEAAIRKSAEAYVAAYNQRDAEALASQWSPQGVYTNPLSGDQVVGREAIEEEFAAIFAELKDAKLEVAIASVEFVSPNVAVERGTAVVVKPAAEPVETAYTAVHIKRDGTWLLDRVTEEEAVAPPSHYEQLKELEWMIGTWVDDDEGATVETTCAWTRNQNFITRTFMISIEGHIDMSGMQFIGWDPAEERIRSWVFDSDGGFGEATWTNKDDRWIINASAVLPDGRRASAVNIMTRFDDSTMSWEATGRDVDGEVLPNVAPVTIRKVDQQ